MQKNIFIFLISDSILNFLQIFDSNNQKIKEDYIYNTYIFKGDLNKPYKIRIISNTGILNSSFYIDEKYTKKYVFDTRRKSKFHKVFIKIIDQNYTGLKIEKGDIKLWQNHIT